MLIHTVEGKRSIDEDLVVCVDQHYGEIERCMVTVYFLYRGTGYRHIGERAPRRRLTAVGCVVELAASQADGKDVKQIGNKNQQSRQEETAGNARSGACQGARRR